jgi:hypothetical protein
MGRSGWRYERAGIDQVMFIQQSGANRHEHVCESLEVFAGLVMPEFKARDEVRDAQRRRELAPFIDAALARKPKMAPLADAAIPRRSLLPQGDFLAPQFRPWRRDPDPSPTPAVSRWTLGLAVRFAEQRRRRAQDALTARAEPLRISPS